MAQPPPSACRVEPVMKLERGEARKSTAWAISSGSAVRPSGNARPSSSLVSPHSASTPSVLVGPGATLLTRTPRGPELGGPGAGEGFHGGLGGAVSGCAGNALEATMRGDVDDAAASALEHPGHQAGGQEVGAADVGVERLLERHDFLVDGQRRRKAGRVVDQNVDVPCLVRQAISPNRYPTRSAWMKRAFPPIAAAAALPRCTSRPVMMTEAPSPASNRAHASPMPAVPPVINAVWSGQFLYPLHSPVTRCAVRPRRGRLDRGRGGPMRCAAVAGHVTPAT